MSSNAQHKCSAPSASWPVNATSDQPLLTSFLSWKELSRTRCGLEHPSAQSGLAVWTCSLQALCHLLTGRAWDMEWLLGPCRVLEVDKLCLATTKLSTCDPQHSHPASKPSTVPVSGKKGIPVKPRIVGTLRQFSGKILIYLTQIFLRRSDLLPSTNSWKAEAISAELP